MARLGTERDHAKDGTPESRKAERERIARAVAEFRKGGGSIERVPFGVSGERPVSPRRALSIRLRGTPALHD